MSRAVVAVVAAMCLLAVVPLAHAATVSPRSVCWEGEEWGLCAPAFAAVALDSLPAFPLTQSHTATVTFSLRINTTGLVWCGGGGGGVFSGRVVTCASSRALCSPHSAHSTQHGMGSVRASTFDSDVEGEYEVRFEAQFVPESVGDISVVAVVHFATCEGANATDHDVTVAVYGVDVVEDAQPEKEAEGIVYLVLVVAVLIALSFVFLLVLVVRFRNSDPFNEAKSNVGFDVALLVLALIGVSSLFANQDLSDWKCQALPFWRGLPLVSTISLFFGRCYELWWEMRNHDSGHEAWKVRFGVSAPWIVAMLILIITEAVVSPPRVEDTTRSWGISRVCGGEYKGLHVVRELFLLFLLLLAVWVMHTIAKTRQRELERLLFIGANVAILLWINVIPLVVTENPSQRFFRASATSLSILCIVIYSLMVPKCLAVLRPAPKKRALRKTPMTGPLNMQPVKRSTSQSAMNTERVTRVVNGAVPPEVQDSLRRTWEMTEVMTGLIVECMPVPRTIMDEAVRRVKELNTHLRSCRYIKKRITLQALKPAAQNVGAIVLMPRLGRRSSHADKCASMEDMPQQPTQPSPGGSRRSTHMESDHNLS